MKWAFVLNLFFACFELVGGLWVNSMAIVSDAIHDFGDALSLAFGIWLEGKSKKGGDAQFSYGYRRFSLLAAVFTGGVLLTGSCFVLGHSIQRVWSPEPVNAPWMTVFAVVGIVVNGFAFLKLRGGGGHGHHGHHHHGHGHKHAHKHDHADHDHDHSKDQVGTTPVHARMWELHFIEDILGWVIVLFGGIAMMFYDVPWLDGAMAVGLSVWIIYNVLKNLKTTFVILLQGMPSGSDLPAVEKFLSKVDGVLSVHHLHLWSMDGETHILTGHIVIGENISMTELGQLKGRIKGELAKRFNISEATLEFECEGDSCADPNHG